MTATQFTPSGIVAVQEGPRANPEEVIPGGAFVAQLRENNRQQSLPGVPAPVAKQRPVKATSADEPMTARQMRAMARRRLKVVQREIKARANLDAERAQLLRLIEALTDNQPAADVRPLRAATGR